MAKSMVWFLCKVLLFLIWKSFEYIYMIYKIKLIFLFRRVPLRCSCVIKKVEMKKYFDLKHARFHLDSHVPVSFFTSKERFLIKKIVKISFCCWKDDWKINLRAILIRQKFYLHFMIRELLNLMFALSGSRNCRIISKFHRRSERKLNSILISNGPVLCSNKQRP